MATIKTIQYVCPDCKRKVGLMGYPQRKLQFYGCKLRTCRHCGAKFMDTRLQEIGLYAKEQTFPGILSLRMGWLIYYIFVVICWVLAAFQGNFAGTVPVFLLILAAGLVVQAASGVLLLAPRKKRWQNEYDRSRELLAIPAYYAKVTGGSLPGAQP